MDGGAGEAGASALVRWEATLLPDARRYLDFPSALPPSATQPASDQQPVEQGTARAAAALLRETDVAYLRPLHSPAPLPPEARLAALQRQVLTADPEAFSHVAAAPTARPLSVEPRPSTREPLERPPAKKAKVAKLKRGGNKAEAEETPVEEARKLAEAFDAYVQQFLCKHEKEAEAEGSEEDEAAPVEDDGAAEAEDEDEDDRSDAQASAAKRVHQEVRRLAEEARRVSGVPAAAQQLPADTLARLLRLLRRLVEGGRDKMIEGDDTEGSARIQQVLTGMEAAIAALHIMTVPDMPPPVYNEDVMESIIELTRFHLTFNAFPFHDARLRAAHRPKLGTAGEEEDDGGGAKGNKKKKKGGGGGRRGKQAAGGLGIPAAIHALVDRAQAVLGLLADLLGLARLPGAVLLPLLRAALVSLAAEGGLSVLQAKATSLAVAAFQVDPGLRATIFDEMFAQVMPYQGGSKHAPRDFLAGEEGSVRIQMVSAAVMQMVQASMDLPAMDCVPEQLTECFKAAVGCCEYFWGLCLAKLPSARAQKSESDMDFRVLLDQLVRDLLEMASLPEWPVAAFMLLRLLAALGGERGLRHADPHACVDLLGMVAARLAADELAGQRDAGWLEAAAARAGHEGEVEEGAQALLLRYLGDQRRVGRPAAASARRFLLGRAFAEEAAALQRHEAGEEELQQLLLGYRKQAEELATLVCDSRVEPADARRLAAALTRASLGKAQAGLLAWLLESTDPARQPAPTTRAKAVKALGDVVAADTRVLAAPAVQAGVDAALQDEAISVREAAVALLGRHIAGDRELALRLFNTLARASTDAGTSVRKAAIKILWEGCMRAPGFPRATEAAKHVLMRGNDPEESVQNEVAKVFHSLWFSPRMETGEGGGAGAVQRSAGERARQLAEVATAVYEAGGKGIHLPLDVNHPLIEWRAGREISEALLEEFLRAEEAAAAPQDCTGLPFLLSLHAFAVTDVQLCMPAKDAAKFVRSLAPYLKIGGGARPGPDAQRRAAEMLLCVLSLLDGVLSQLGATGVEAAVVGELVRDLAALINRHHFVQVLASACKCLATLAQSSPAAADQLAQTASVYRGWLRAPGGNLAHLARFLFIMGQLCRYGATLLEKATLEDPITMADCLQLFVYYSNLEHGIKVAEAALAAMGALTIARPSVMVEPESRAKELMKGALQRSAPEAFKLKALANLTELLRADEESLLALQQEAGGGGAAAGAAGRKRKGEPGGAAAGTGAAVLGGGAVQVQNGEGDTLSQSSSILQDNWEAVLALATNASPADPSSAAAGAEGHGVHAGTLVRRRVLELMETVLRGGLVGPWTAVEPLCALCTDPLEEVRVRALRLLRQLADKHPRYFDAERLARGVAAAAAFHAALGAAAAGEATPQRAGAVPPAALRGLGALYAQVVQPQRALKLEFLKALLRRFRAAASLAAAGAAEADLPLLAFCATVAAGLPYRRGDEPCTLVQEINAVIATQGENVLLELRRSLEAASSPAAAGAGVCGGATATVAALAASSAAAALEAQCKASLALSMLLVLKDYLKKAYGLTAERIAAFGGAGEKRKAEERQVVAPAQAPLYLSKLDLEAPSDRDRTRAQYRVFKTLMKQDADSADYEHMLSSSARRGGGAAAAGAEAALSPDGADEDQATPDWVNAMGAAAAPTTGRGRGRGRRGGGSAGGRGRGGGSTGGRGRSRGSTAGSKKKKRKRGESSDSEDEDEDYAPTAAARKRLY
eukprot:scaffold29.g5943.t1